MTAAVGLLISGLELLAQAEPAGAKGGGLQWDVLILMLLPVAAIFWLLSRSQRKRDQERRDMLARLKKGDQVVTMGGIYGEVVRLSDREVVLQVDKRKDVELRLQRGAISAVVSSKAPVEETIGQKDTAAKP